MDHIFQYIVIDIERLWFYIWN